MTRGTSNDWAKPVLVSVAGAHVQVALARSSPDSRGGDLGFTRHRPQSEVLYACTLAYTQTGDEKWLVWLEKAHKYIYDHFYDGPDKPGGGGEWCVQVCSPACPANPSPGCIVVFIGAPPHTQFS
jgi:hypothetical protein